MQHHRNAAISKEEVTAHQCTEGEEKTLAKNWPTLLQKIMKSCCVHKKLEFFLRSQLKDTHTIVA